MWQFFDWNIFIKRRFSIFYQIWKSSQVIDHDHLKMTWINHNYGWNLWDFFINTSVDTRWCVACGLVRNIFCRINYETRKWKRIKSPRTEWKMIGRFCQGITLCNLKSKKKWLIQQIQSLVALEITFQTILLFVHF